MLECDASGVRIGAILRNNQHPISFESQELREMEILYSIYDKEILAIMHSLTKFNQYLACSWLEWTTIVCDIFLGQKDLNERQ